MDEKRDLTILQEEEMRSAQGGSGGGGVMHPQLPSLNRIGSVPPLSAFEYHAVSDPDDDWGLPAVRL